MMKTLELQDLSCGGCAVTIRTGLDLAGFTSVRVDLLKKPHTVTVDIIDDEHLELLKIVLRDHGYPLVGDKVDLPDPSDFKFA